MYERDVIGLFGGLNTIKEFYAEISIGTPSQTFNVQLDTGSSNFLIYGSSCVGCPESKSFDVQSSSSAVAIGCSGKLFCDNCSSSDQCEFKIGYGGGAKEIGLIYQDVLKIEGFPSLSIDFGLIESSETSGLPFEKPPVSGIWGLAFPSLSTWKGETVFEELVNSQGIYNSFSLCLTTSNPVMSMGVDFSSTSGILWAPIVEETFYVVDVPTIKAGNITIQEGYTGQTIIDSGTTLMYLNPTTFQNFKEAIQSDCTLVGACGEQNLFNQTCFEYTSEQIAAFPTLSFYVEASPSFWLNFTANDYLVGDPFKCLVISYTNSDDAIILGDIFMQNYHVIFDIQQLRLGFGDISTCPKESSSFPISSKEPKLFLFLICYFLSYLI